MPANPNSPDTQHLLPLFRSRESRWDFPYCCQLTRAMEVISFMYDWWLNHEKPDPSASHQSCLGLGPEDNLPCHSAGVYTCIAMITLVCRSFEIKISDWGLIYVRRYQEVMSQDPLLMENRVTGQTVPPCDLLFLWKALWLITDWVKVSRKRDIFPAEQQLDSVFILAGRTGGIASNPPRVYIN